MNDSQFQTTTAHQSYSRPRMFDNHRIIALHSRHQESHQRRGGVLTWSVVMYPLIISLYAVIAIKSIIGRLLKTSPPTGLESRYRRFLGSDYNDISLCTARRRLLRRYWVQLTTIMLLSQISYSGNFGEETSRTPHVLRPWIPRLKRATIRVGGILSNGDRTSVVVISDGLLMQAGYRTGSTSSSSR